MTTTQAELRDRLKAEFGNITPFFDTLAPWPYENADEFADTILKLLPPAPAVGEANTIERDRNHLVGSIEQIKKKLEAGLCSFSAESKHLFLKEAMHIAEHAERNAALAALGEGGA